MKPWWLIQEGTHQRYGGSEKFIYTVKEQGMSIITAKYIPFGGMDYSFINKNQPIVFYGALNMIWDFQNRATNWREPEYRLLSQCKPFAWCDWDKLKCQTYYSHYGKYLLQKEYGFYPLSEVNRLKNYLYERYSKDGRIFIRPDANNKTFTGELVKYDLFNHWYIQATEDQDLSIFSVVSRPEEIETEWRFIICKGKVIAGSQYQRYGWIELSESYEQDAAEFAEEVAKVWQPHPIFVMDIASTPNGYRLVEIGSVNAAGFYEADLRAIVRNMAEIAEEEYGN